MRYGDNDTYGDPTRLLRALEEELERHGISSYTDASNSYDLSLSITGHSAAHLLAILRGAPIVEGDAAEAVVEEMVDFD